MPLLCVNVDHVATIRQARLGTEPDPIVAAAMCELAGAAGIIMHLREDRRHVQDRDIDLIAQTIQTKFNFEMAATDEMQAFALKINPVTVCLVPEKRAELTTEGGLSCAGHEDKLKKYLAPIHAAGIKSSLFIDADPAQIKASHEIGADYVEIHTGHYADAKTRSEQKLELNRIIDGIKRSQDLGLKVNLGHGLNYTNILDFANVPGICEYSIGHSIMARAIFVGIDRAVKDMVEIIRTFVD
ncbi:pyridoxine 5-phosphate synthase [Maridesulfovibrio ferrireducens]|uniref:Pyridoxine 5'-phosphate synthase n=1 Tax=Maridesulfovibrio ferrireducens TaxID=246191 RepID=A0A1G9I5S8_9BACT|nr:pyridoxine 5'-phosphate synthase [Maridesulfovibrio ferrireducens]SDL20405.1 pyridoxine 5-phosphate synthase [Maridesulfovibrio ferrireducens]